MEQKLIQELSEVIQSSHLNFLFGAGTSTPFLPLLGNIEKALNDATTDSEREVQYKEYFSKVMLPNKKIINGELAADDNFLQTESSYKNFFNSITDILLQRKSTILEKQANLFTTNIDIFLETILEKLQIEYNDGFAGRFTPQFNLSNFKKTIYQKSLHFEHISEIPLFNIIKIHGSLTWKHDVSGEKIIFSYNLNHFDKALSSKTGKKFIAEYRKILIVNPELAKHLETVLTVYYSELLRLYSSELEKENSSLFVLGFSMEDRHIREITLRAAKSNPTLRVMIFCSKKTLSGMQLKMEQDQHPNIKIYTPENEDKKFTLNYLCDDVLKKIKPKPKLNE